MASTDPFGEDSYAQVKMEPAEDEEFLYGKKDEAQAPEVKGEDPFETSMQPPSDSIPPETEEPPEEDYEDDDEEEGVQIVLNTEAINSPDAAAGTGAFPKRPLFSRPQPNQQRPGSTPIPNYQAQRGQPNAQPVQSPIVGQPPGSKSAFDIDIDGLEEKPWRKQGADITDFFNYGFNEETWKIYCQKQVTLRLEQSMQGKIKVYSSEQGASDMPAELLALTGGDSKSRSKQDRPSSSSMKREGGSSKSTSGPPGDWSRLPDHSRRRQREQDDSVIQVLASGDDRPEDRDRDRERSPRSGSPGSPRGPPFMGLPMGRFPIPIPGMPPRGPPPYDRDFRRRSRSPPRYRDDRGPPDRDPRYRDEFRDPRDRRREERPRDERPREDRPREERPKEREERPKEREERPKEREERREERSRDKDRDESKRAPKREESDDRKRSRH